MRSFRVSRGTPCRLESATSAEATVSVASDSRGDAMGTLHHCIERHSEFEFPVDGHAENAPPALRVATRGHGVFLCRGDRFASIDIAAASNSASHRSSEPYSLKPEATENTQRVGLNLCQQLAGFLASPVAARMGLRAMFVDSLRLAGHHAEQLAKVLHKATPDLRRDPQSVKQGCKLFRCRTSLPRTSLSSCPVQQAQIIRR